MDIGPGSTAFVIDPSRIYINLKGKYPYGHVAPNDYERVRNEIKQGIEGLTYETGEAIVKKVYHKEDLYHGPLTNLAPDLVVLSRHGFDLKGRVNSGKVFGRTDLQGMHTQDDAFFYSTTGNGCKNIFEAENVIVNTFKM
jgi:predicted AlkP superfamily phosphohydrolase/phosphomutase